MSDHTPEHTSNTNEIESKLNRFLDNFELVFDHDWPVTEVNLNNEHLISKRGTFLRPGVRDEENNWANRAGLLDSYRDLCESIGRPVGQYPVRPEF